MNDIKEENTVSNNEKKRFFHQHYIAPIIVGIVLALFSYFVSLHRNPSKETTNENNSGQQTNVENNIIHQVVEQPTIEQRQEQQKEKQELSVKPQEKTITIPEAGSVKKTRIEETGKSSKKVDEERAWHAAIEAAKKQLENQGISSDSFRIDHSKSFAVETERDGWSAIVVIFVYTDD